MIQIKNYKPFFILICLIFVSDCLVAQNTNTYIEEDDKNNKESNQKEFVKTSSENADSALTDSTNYIINRINNIDAHIKAIDTKVDYVRSDEFKKVKAEKEGWFTEMQKIKNELILERTLLKSKLSLNTK